jgi:hypothetical protein
VANDGCVRSHQVGEHVGVNLGAPMTLLIFDDEIVQDFSLFV